MFLGGAEAQKVEKGKSLEALEKDLKRGKLLFRRKRGKVRNLDDSGHKGLADFVRDGSVLLTLLK